MLGIWSLNERATAFASTLAFSGVSAVAEIEKTCYCCSVLTEMRLANSLVETL